MLYALEPACWVLSTRHRFTKLYALWIMDYAICYQLQRHFFKVHLHLLRNVLCYLHYGICYMLHLLGATFNSSQMFYAICTMLYATCFTLLGSTFKLSQMYYAICLILHSQLIGPTLDPHPTSALNCRIRLSLTGSKKYVKMKVLKKTLSGPF